MSFIVPMEMFTSRSFLSVSGVHRGDGPGEAAGIDGIRPKRRRRSMRHVRFISMPKVRHWSSGPVVPDAWRDGPLRCPGRQGKAADNHSSVLSARYRLHMVGDGFERWSVSTILPAL